MSLGMIILILVGIVFLFFNFGRIWRVVAGSVVGMVALVLINKIGIAIGINAVTCLICGILGIPGFAMLFLFKLLV